MCYPSPGPRCSGHTGARLERLDAKLDKVKAEMSKNSIAITRTLEEKEGGPTGLKRKQKRIEKLNSANAKNYEVFVKISDDLKNTQIDYDGTPAGQKKLQSVIDNPDSTREEVKAAKQRMQKGALMRSWRMNQKERMERNKKNNFTAKQERQQKIFLNDPKTISYINEQRGKKVLAKVPA